MLAWENFTWQVSPELCVSGKRTGHGPKLLMIIPGFGNDRHWFDEVLKTCPDGWTFVSVDIPPFFGSDWTGDAPIDLETLKMWVDFAVIETGTREFHLMAFSLGARVSFGIYEVMPSTVRSLIFICPDGLRVHPMYAFAMYTRVGRYLFRRILNQPKRFLAILRILYAMRLVSNSVYKLSMAQFESESRRRRLYKAWFAWSGIRPSRKNIIHQSAAHDTRWFLFWGNDDKVLSPRLGRKFARQVQGAVFESFPGGHFMIRKPAPELVNRIQDILENT